MSAVREINRETAIKTVSEWLADYIMQLPLGSEHTLAMVLKSCMEAHGYKETGNHRDCKYSRDGGDTYLIDCEDFMEIRELTTEILRGKRELNSSMYASDIVGLPEDIPFTILEDNGTALMRIEISTQRGTGHAEITVFKNSKAEIIYRAGLDDMEGIDKTIELPETLMNRINSILEAPLISRKPENYTKNADFIVMDGNSVEVTFYINCGQKEFYYSNLGDYLDYLDDCPQTKLISDLLISVLKYVSKETGRNISLRSF